MKDDIRTKILETAKELFGEQGYNQVSMRDIASVLGISVGNLTYHYKKKEDLIEAALLDGDRRFVKPPPAETFEDLQAFFFRQFRRYKEAAYYFRHYRQLAQISPRIYDLQVDTLRQVADMYLQSFARLEKNGLMQPEELPGQRAGLARAIMTLSVFGDLPLQEDDPKEDFFPRLRSIWAILYPFFTPKGKISYKEAVAPQLDAGF